MTNALGSVKFLFPNPFSIYLHDTPSKELFQKSQRAFSSGCIRVQDPLLLAALLLNKTEWNIDKIKNTVATHITQTVLLKEKPDIHILYWTAWTDISGVVNFRKDIYERDQQLYMALKEKP